MSKVGSTRSCILLVSHDDYLLPRKPNRTTGQVFQRTPSSNGHSGHDPQSSTLPRRCVTKLAQLRKIAWVYNSDFHSILLLLVPGA